MNQCNILDQLDQIISSRTSRDEKLQLICNLLHDRVEVFDWVGFYIASTTEDEMLELGPFTGEETDHTKIPYGTGICGQAAETKETFVVQDVSEASNYLACSIHVKSEIVVPVMKNGTFVAELDIDSHKKNAISKEVRELCEEVCVLVSSLF
jgi:GAF domain-containing protein